MSTVDKAIRNAAYIPGEIDKKWPSKAPAPFANKPTLCRITRFSWLAYSPCIHNQDSDTDCADAIQSSLDSELPFRVHNNKVASCVRYLSQPHHLTANGDSARADCQAQCQRKHIKLLGGVGVNGFRQELRAGRWGQ